MLRRRAIELARQERRQRRALALFAVVLLGMLGLCGVIGARFLVPPTPLIPAGRVSDYTDNQPRRFGVPKLKTSELIHRRDMSVSEDVIYVRRESDGGWIALLGVDTLSGCFLYWDEQASLYRDINCLGSRYTPDGRYEGGLITGEEPQHMARLPVEIHDDQVFVRDQLDRIR